MGSWVTVEGRLCWAGLECNWLKTVKPNDMNQVLPEETTAWCWWAWPQEYRSGFSAHLRWLSATTYPSWQSVSSLVKWRWLTSLGLCADRLGDIYKAFGTVISIKHLTSGSVWSWKKEATKVPKFVIVHPIHPEDKGTEVKEMGVQVPGELNSWGTGMAAQDFLWPPGVLLQDSPLTQPMALWQMT